MISTTLPTPSTEVLAPRRTDLGGTGWTLHATTGPIPAELRTALSDGIPATVPSEVHVDLLAAGLVPDPFDADNEQTTAWIGYCDWQYRRSFELSAADLDAAVRHDLVAEGLDTAATVTLNGTVVATTANQHRSYRFDVRDVLVPGPNELVVDLRSPIEYAREQEGLLGHRPRVMHHPFNAIRKRASDFGWDWGIDLSSSGIWRPIALESWSGVRIASVRPLVDIVDGHGVLTAHVTVERADRDTDLPVRVTVAGTTSAGTVPPGSIETTVTVTTDAVELWWPSGHGAQRLYEVTVEVDGVSWTGRVGFRTTRLDTTPDADGSPFRILVNDVPIWVKGANWIPGDALLTRMTRERYRKAVGDAVDAGMNLLRVWGGGTYESDDFYDVCDEHGILVWQDFPFACAAYSEEEPLRSEVEAEAREAVTRLSGHPSLVLWNGCNENIWAYVEWGWAPALVGCSWGDGYYRGLLPAIVAELDPTRPYSPGSPYSFLEYAHPNDPRHGTMHIWDVWNERDWTAYAEHRPRFASEFGFQGPPAWSTLTAVVHDEPLRPDGPQMLVHQKADDGNGKLERGLGGHFPRPTTIEDWHWATQLNQARAVRFAVEGFRADHPRCSGAVVWQLNDDWPVVSWAAVDHAGVRKPLWYALRETYAPVAMVLRPDRDGVPTLSVHADQDHPWEGDVQFERRDVATGEVLGTASVPVSVRSRGLSAVAVPASVASDPGASVLVASGHPRSGGEPLRTWLWSDEDDAPPLGSTADSVEVSVQDTADGFAVTVTANALVRDLFLQVDRIAPSAGVDRGLVSLLPGERATFRVVLPAGHAVPSRQELSYPVLCSAGDLVARRE